MTLRERLKRTAVGGANTNTMRVGAFDSTKDAHLQTITAAALEHKQTCGKGQYKVCYKVPGNEKFVVLVPSAGEKLLWELLREYYVQSILHGEMSYVLAPYQPQDSNSAAIAAENSVAKYRSYFPTEITRNAESGQLPADWITKLGEEAKRDAADIVSNNGGREVQLSECRVVSPKLESYEKAKGDNYDWDMFVRCMGDIYRVGWVHADLKLDNLMVRDNNVVPIDFGEMRPATYYDQTVEINELKSLNEANDMGVPNRVKDTIYDIAEAQNDMRERIQNERVQDFKKFIREGGTDLDHLSDDKVFELLRKLSELQSKRQKTTSE